MSSGEKALGELEIRRLLADDAAKLVACFERCYGATYPSGDFYDAELLRRRIETGSLRSVVALDRGALVGHTGLTLREAGAHTGRGHPNVAVAGNTVVDPAYRGRGVLGRLGRALRQLCCDDGFVGYVHYPTTAHTIMQERSVKQNGVETGILLAWVPADTDYRDFERGRGRLAATVVYQPISESPTRTIYLPERYDHLLLGLYRRAGLTRSVAASPTRMRCDSSSLAVVRDDRRGLFSVTAGEIGRDFCETLDGLLAENPVSLIHVDLGLDDPAVSWGVEWLRQRRFLYCGLFPGFGRSDVLRMQRIEVSASDGDPFAVRLANPGARELLGRMRIEAEDS